jgi:hypothetical protein
MDMQLSFGLLALALLSGCGSVRFSTSNQTVDARTAVLSGVVVTVTRIPKPWWAPRAVVRRRFASALAEYEAVPGLEQKAFTISDGGKFGGIYQWHSRAEADAWFSPKWFARVKDKYGGGTMEPFTAELALFGPTRIEATPIDARGSSFPLTLTLLELDGASASAKLLLVAAHRSPPGFVRGWVLTGSNGSLAIASLWADRDLAVLANDADRLRRIALATGATAARIEWFEAPVFIDAPARNGATAGEGEVPAR